MAGSRPIHGRLVASLLGASSLGRSIADATARLRGDADRLELYWRADDATSHVMAQLASRLAGEYRLHVDVIPVPAPAADVDPEPALRAQLAIRDAQAIASRYDVEFPTGEVSLPSRDRIRRAVTIALATRETDDSLPAIIAAGNALWGNDGDALTHLAKELGAAAGMGLRETLDSNYELLRKRGHYHSATLRYRGEWFEGPFRVRNLEERLAGVAPSEGSVLRERPAPRVDVDPEASIEMFFSFRSPYSYLGIEQIAPYVRGERGVPLNFRLRPVLPMVMRGLQVPRVKKLMLVRDAYREAKRLNIPFGRIVDPVGEGAERCVALYSVLEQSAQPDRAFDFALEAARGIWSEAIDVATDAGLRRVAERAGVTDEELSDAEARRVEGLAMAEQNRVALHALGLWGVPSFRVGDLSLWGQDRLPLVLGKVGIRAPE